LRRNGVYTFSTGHNWGYGTSPPVADNSVLVDLSRMNRILHVHADLGLLSTGAGCDAGPASQALSGCETRFFCAHYRRRPNRPIEDVIQELTLNALFRATHMTAFLELRRWGTDGRPGMHVRGS
jgi:hypothetical protein